MIPGLENWGANFWAARDAKNAGVQRRMERNENIALQQAQEKRQNARADAQMMLQQIASLDPATGLRAGPELLLKAQDPTAMRYAVGRLSDEAQAAFTQRAQDALARQQRQQNVGLLADVFGKNPEALAASMSAYNTGAPRASAATLPTTTAMMGPMAALTGSPWSALMAGAATMPATMKPGPKEDLVSALQSGGQIAGDETRRQEAIKARELAAERQKDLSLPYAQVDAKTKATQATAWKQYLGEERKKREAAGMDPAKIDAEMQQLRIEAKKRAAAGELPPQIPKPTAAGSHGMTWDERVTNNWLAKIAAEEANPMSIDDKRKEDLALLRMFLTSRSETKARMLQSPDTVALLQRMGAGDALYPVMPAPLVSQPVETPEE